MSKAKHKGGYLTTNDYICLVLLVGSVTYSKSWPVSRYVQAAAEGVLQKSFF